MSPLNKAEPLAATDSPPEWLHHAERGSLFWMRVLRALSLALGRRCSRLILYGVALYFALAAAPARQASRAYLTRALGRPASWSDIYRHILTFATATHDRLFLLNDKASAFDLHCGDQATLDRLLARGKGVFLFGAHLGSFEAMRALAHARPELQVSLAMFPDNARRISSVLSAINPRRAQDIIPLGQLDSMLRVHHKLESGAWVGILADRSLRGDKHQSVPFLGAPACFPTGPFRMAAMLRQPVYFMAGIYLGGRRYEIYFEEIADFSATPRSDRDTAIQAAVARYAAILEQHCQAHPYNWFNFFDFWGSARHAPAT